MAENITRCPKCKTSFRIPDAHLKSAKGAVRCGSCLNIFNAKEHLISIKKEAPAPASTHSAPVQKTPAPKSSNAKSQNTEAKDTAPKSKPETTSKPASTFAKALAPKPEKPSPKQVKTQVSKAEPKIPRAPHSDDDDVLISDDMDNRSGSKYDDSFNTENDFNLTELGHSRTGQYDVNLFEREMEDDSGDSSSDSDESWALDLLNEDNDPPPPAPTQEELEEEEERKITQEFEASFNFKLVDDQPQDKPEVQDTFDLDDYPESDDSGFATGEFDTVDLNDHDEHPKQDSQHVKREEIDQNFEDDYDDGYDVGYDSDQKTGQEENSDYDDGYDVGYDEDYEEDYDDEQNVLKDDDEDDYPSSVQAIKERYFEDEEVFVSEPFEKEGANYLDAIEPEPVEFSFKRHSNFWQSNILWGTLAVAAGLVLFIQVAVVKFDALSMIEPYRSYYGIACKYANCKLPELVNRSKIRTANLVVRSHPKMKNALIVDAVLQNTAKFEQSFPTLDLVFTDSREKPVSARRLAPNEYLRGELAGRTNMPVKQPVHIAIEISDPGPEAVGYRISIVD